MITCIIILLGGGATLLYASRIALKVSIVVAVVLLQFLWFAWPQVSFNRQAEDSYRISERLEARRAWFDHPAPDTMTAYENERRLLAAHLARWEMLTAGLVLALDVVGIWWFWTHETKGTSAQLGASPNGGPGKPSSGSGVAVGRHR